MNASIKKCSIQKKILLQFTMRISVLSLLLLFAIELVITNQQYSVPELNTNRWLGSRMKRYEISIGWQPLPYSYQRVHSPINPLHPDDLHPCLLSIKTIEESLEKDEYVNGIYFMRDTIIQMCDEQFGYEAFTIQSVLCATKTMCKFESAYCQYGCKECHDSIKAVDLLDWYIFIGGRMYYDFSSPQFSFDERPFDEISFNE